MSRRRDAAVGSGPSARGCSGVVLAGGRSTRFGRDKLAEPLGDRPLLAHAIAAVASVAADVVIAAGSNAMPDLGDARQRVPPTRVVRDPEPDGGPLVGLLAGLEAAREPVTLVVGGDMPGLQPAVLALLVDTLGAHPEAEAAVLDDGGRARPLPAALRVGAATGAARDAIGRGARSLHALLDGLRVAVVAAEDWRTLDPDGATLRDVDRPADLPDPEAHS